MITHLFGLQKLYKEPSLLNQGISLAEDNMVRDWVLLPDGAWQVEVKDENGDVAKVELEMGVRRVKDWICNCQDGASGIPCEHLAAAVYAFAAADGKPQAKEIPAETKATVSKAPVDEIEEEMPAEKVPQKRGRKPTGQVDKQVLEQTPAKQADKGKNKKSGNAFEEMLQGLSKEDLIKFMVHQSKRNKLFINEVQLYFADRAGDGLGSDYENMVLDTIKTIRVRDFDAPYEYERLPSYKTAMKLMTKIMKKGQQLLDENNFSEAFRLAKGVIKAGLSTGNYRALLYEDIGLSLQLIRNISKKVQSFAMKDDIFDFLAKEMPKYPAFKSEDYPMTNEIIEDLLIDSGKITFYKNFLKNAIDNNKVNGYYSAEYVNKLIKLDPDQTENIYLQYKNNDYVFEKLILFYQSKNRFAEAKNLLMEKIEVKEQKGKNDYDLVSYGDEYKFYHSYLGKSKWQDMLLKILEKEEDWAGIINRLKDSFQKDFANQKYLLYKKAYLQSKPEKWPELARSIMEKGKFLLNTRIQIAAEENFLEDLLKYITQGDFSTQGAIDKYFAKLFPKYPKESLELLRKRIDVLSKDAHNENYQKMYELLFLMAQKGDEAGKKMALQLTDEYLEKYGLRRNMKALLLQVKQKLK